MNMNQLIRTFALLISALAFTSAQASTVAVSNLTESTHSLLANGLTNANSFTTGAGAGWTLASVDANLNIYNPPTNVTAYLYADDASKPGTQLGTVQVNSVASGDQTVNFNFGNLLLGQNTTYWFAIAANTSVDWAQTLSTNETAGLLGWSIGNRSLSGTDWGNDSDPLKFAVNVNPVPIPAAVWLFGSALAGLGVIGRRKQPA